MHLYNVRNMMRGAKKVNNCFSTGKKSVCMKNDALLAYVSQ